MLPDVSVVDNPFPQGKTMAEKEAVEFSFSVFVVVVVVVIVVPETKGGEDGEQQASTTKEALEWKRWSGRSPCGISFN